MRIISITLLIFLSCANFYAQDKQQVSNDTVIDFSSLSKSNSDCRDANNYGLRKGKVIEIINGNTFHLEVDDELEKETYKVILAGIDVASNSSILKNLLIENLLNKNVMVTGNRTKEGSKEIYGIVNPYAPNNLGEVNRYFLKNGLAKYIEPKRNLVPNYILFEYRKIAKQAKEAKLGIWAK